jgi:hypothetical protein
VNWADELEAAPTSRLLLTSVIRGAASPIGFELALRVRAAAGDVAGMLVPPLFTAVLFYPLFNSMVRSGRYGRAVLASLVWALACSIVSIVLFAKTGDRYVDVVWNAEKYRREMFAWVATGMGEESDPVRFIPKHAEHFVAFAALSLVSVGFLGLALGAALLHYMNFYVGSLARAAGSPFLTGLAGWPPYAIVRVAGFVTVAVALTAFALARWRGATIDSALAKRTLAIGVALVGFDVVIKVLVAPAWGRMLNALAFP